MDENIITIENEGKLASFEIDRKTYKIDNKNFNQSKSKKTQIILAGSLRKGSNHISRLKKRDFGLTKTWPMFTIRRDGKIFQHFDPNYSSDFMGHKETDRKAITVMLENMGMLSYDYDKSKYINWVNEECDESLVREKLWKANRYWESYTEEQLMACVNLCAYLCRTYGVKRECLGHYVSHEGATIYNGILTRGNYNSDYCDLNPSFDFKRFLKELSLFN